MARVADRLGVSELERRPRGCPDPVEARHVQVIWLLAQGHTVGATSQVTAFGPRWIRPLLERYDASGPDALANGVSKPLFAALPPYSPELRPAETLWPPVDEPVVDTLGPRLDDLGNTIGARCCDLTARHTEISSRTNFSWWPQNRALS